mgnify:CR=1 FL=1
MEIEVRLFAYFRDNRGKRLAFSIDENTTPKDILEKLKIDPKDVAILLINGIDGKLDSKLKENDRLSLFPPVGGG